MFTIRYDPCREGFATRPLQYCWDGFISFSSQTGMRSSPLPTSSNLQPFVISRYPGSRSSNQPIHLGLINLIKSLCRIADISEHASPRSVERKQKFVFTRTRGQRRPGFNTTKERQKIGWPTWTAIRCKDLTGLWSVSRLIRIKWWRTGRRLGKEKKIFLKTLRYLDSDMGRCCIAFILVWRDFDRRCRPESALELMTPWTTCLIANTITSLYPLQAASHPPSFFMLPNMSGSNSNNTSLKILPSGLRLTLYGQLFKDNSRIGHVSEIIGIKRLL